ncbi:MAG: YhdT family protein [Selenomonas sp.]|uniref:YhdT family protein n=1 Tax=Selenomonas sp. TaxID=2053611 RepID=UPI0025FFA4B1|nr:YhdT family protein [Selenomonas sp.]MCR5758361.1 YhdT family protein [Selenomonas sp.]
MTEWEKYQQIRREAAYTGLALLVLILFWCWAGFGLSGVEMEIFGLPLWVVTSSIGVWFFALVLVQLLLKYVFRDMSLTEKKGDDEDE